MSIPIENRAVDSLGPSCLQARLFFLCMNVHTTCYVIYERILLLYLPYFPVCLSVGLSMCELCLNRAGEGDADRTEREGARETPIKYSDKNRVHHPNS